MQNNNSISSSDSSSSERTTPLNRELIEPPTAIENSDNENGLSLHDFNTLNSDSKANEEKLLSESTLSPRVVAWLTKMQWSSDNITQNGLLSELEAVINKTHWGQIIRSIMTTLWARKIAFYITLSHQGINPVYSNKAEAPLLADQEQDYDSEPETDDLNLSTTAPYSSTKVSKKSIWFHASGATLPLKSETMLKRAYAIIGLFEGFESFERVWSIFLTSLLLNSVINYYLYPTERGGTTLSENLLLSNPFTAYDENEAYLAESLSEPTVWPVLLGVPIVFGLASAIFQSFHAKTIKPENLQQLIYDIEHYHSSTWHDCGRWFISSLVPDIFPMLLPSVFLYLLPGSHTEHLLETAERLILWDGRISTDERDQLFQAIKSLQKNSSKITKLMTLATIAKITNGISVWDLPKLQSAGIDDKAILQLVQIKLEALRELNYAAYHYYSSHKDRELFLSPLPRYLVANYLLWTIGQPKSIVLQPLFFLYRGIKVIPFILLVKAVIEGIYKLAQEHAEKQACMHEGKQWTYFKDRGQYECTVCGDWPIFYKNMFSDKSCWDDYMRFNRSVPDLLSAIEQIDFDAITSVDLSHQKLNNSGLVTVLEALAMKLSNTQELYLNTSMTDDNNLSLKSAQMIAQLLKHSTIKTLSLKSLNIIDDTSINTALMQGFEKSNLESLDLSNNYFSDNGTLILASTLPLSKIRYLNLSNHNGKPIGDTGIIALANKLEKSKIQNLDLSFNYIKNAGATALAKSLPLSCIQILDLSANSLENEATISLSNGLQKSSVISLNLWSNFIGSAGTIALSKALPNTNISALNLGVNYFDSEGLSALAAALPKSVVEDLNLDDTRIGDDQIKYLANSLSKTQIKKLSLRSNYIKANGMKALADSLPYSKVVNMDLKYNRIGPNGAAAISNILVDTDIEILLLSGNNIGKTGAIYLSKGLIGSQVKILDLWGNNIENDGVTALSQVLPQTLIERLTLASNNIGLKGISNLADALHLSAVEALDLGYNNLKSEGLTPLANSLARSSLQELNLAYNDLENKINHLIEALPKSKLSSLSLQGNNITSLGIEALAKILTTSEPAQHPLWIKFLNSEIMKSKAVANSGPNTHLQKLDLANNKITAQGAIALCEQLAQTDIETNSLNLAENCINHDLIDTSTCTIFSNANRLSPPWIYSITFYSSIQVYGKMRNVIKNTHKELNDYFHPPLLISKNDDNHFEKDSVNKFPNLFNFFGQPQQPTESNELFLNTETLLTRHSYNFSNHFVEPMQNTPNGDTAFTLNPVGLITAYVLYKGLTPCISLAIKSCTKFLGFYYSKEFNNEVSIQEEDNNDQYYKDDSFISNQLSLQ